VRKTSSAAAGSPSLRKKVRVSLGERGYPIEIGYGSLDEVGTAIAKATGAHQVMLVTVPPVARRYAARVERSLKKAGLRSRRFVVPDGERTKNLRQVQKLYEAMLQAGADRSTAVVALGGGVVGDLSGFVAATLFRGVPVVQIPTSLLSMVDSSVGGKTGVNVPAGKNLVGAFHQPKLVWIDGETLTTLPRAQLNAGMAEVVKHAAIADEKLFSRLESRLDGLLALEPGLLVPVLQRNCAIKADVVVRDERESGVRMQLNFGHTLGHAVEALKRYRGVLHGEGVAMGMVFAARRSEELGLAVPGSADRIVDLLGRIGLPTELPGFTRKAYLGALAVDKKKRASHIHFVVLRRIGKAETRPLTPAEILPAKGKGRLGSMQRIS